VLQRVVLALAALYHDEPGMPKPRFYRTLYFGVIAGIVLGIALGALYPATGEQMKPLGDAFIKLIRMMIAPIIFVTVVVGIAGIGDMRKLGRVGVKALLYFEVVTTAALLTGLVVVKVVQPGAGINADARTLDTKSIQQYTSSAKKMTTVEMLMNIIPDTVVDAFARGEILQVLLIAILFGLALASFDKGKSITTALDSVGHVLFGMIGLIMKTAPIGAFGAMAFTIGKYGLRIMLPLGKLMLCVSITCAAFVFIVLGLIARLHGFSLWKFLKYIKEEILIVLGTSSSETVLPRMMLKLEKLGCSKSVVGLVIPSGYSFNLDGTSIYLTIAALFVAQATNTHLSAAEEFTVLVVLMLTSKGAAAVTGGGFITLAATLSSLGTIPVAGITLLLGVDRFMSGMRSLVNLIGNGVATIVVARWEGELDYHRAKRVLDGHAEIETEPDYVAGR
jgi:aerobic C4-dicarboxylate transport protein